MTPAERARRRRRRIRNAWWGPAVFAFLALASFASPWLVPVPRADQMIEVRGQLANFALYGQGSGRRCDFRMASRPELFRADRGYGRLRRGSDARFFVRAEGGAAARAPDGSVWAYALEVDGQGSETLDEAVRRARTYEIVMIVMGFIAAPIAVVLFRMNLDRWKDERNSRIRAATTPC